MLTATPKPSTARITPLKNGLAWKLASSFVASSAPSAATAARKPSIQIRAWEGLVMRFARELDAFGMRPVASVLVPCRQLCEREGKKLVARGSHVNCVALPAPLALPTMDRPATDAADSVP